MQKKITLQELAEELIARIEGGQSIDCCKDELKKLALLVKEKLGQETIEIDWHAKQE